MNKNFAMHLSGVLEGMSYTQAVKVIEGLTERPAFILHDTEELGEVENYTIRFETLIDFRDKRELMLNGNYENSLEKYGIESFYYRIEINPTEEEMVDFLEDFGGDFGEELDKADLTYEVSRIIEERLYDFNFEEVLSYFEDVRTVWDVLVDDEGHFYRAGNDELMSY